MANNGDCLEANISTAGNITVLCAKCSDKTKSVCDVTQLNTTQNSSVGCAAASTTPSNTRYPGEACDDTNKCIYGTCDATNKTCTGVQPGMNCSHQEQCVKGNYCFNYTLFPNSTVQVNGTCQKQLARGAQNCTSHYACQNTQGCYKGNCTDLFSLSLNSTLADNTDLSQALCKSNIAQVNQTTYYCYSPRLNNGMKLNGDGIASCQFGSVCNFTDSFNNTRNETCQCSKDNKGQSLCNRVYDESNSNWAALANAQRKRADNKCHTLSRLNCYDISSGAKTDFYNAVIKTTRASELLYADDCVKQLYASSAYIKIGLFALISLFIHLL